MQLEGGGKSLKIDIRNPFLSAVAELAEKKFLISWITSAGKADVATAGL